MIRKYRTIPIKKSKAVDEPTQNFESLNTIDFNFKDVVLSNDDALIDFSKQNPYFELKKRPNTSAASGSKRERPISSISLLSTCNI